MKQSAPALETLEISTGPAPNAAVIWLHGLGADGHDFAPVIPDLMLPPELGIRFVFPHAPQIPITINGGYPMNAWYDILETSIERKVDTTHLLASSTAVGLLIDREIERGIDSTRIILAGFSQGGAVGYQTALSYPRPLAGLLVLSSYLATRDTLERHPANASILIQIFHGSADPTVPEKLGRQAYETLVNWEYEPSYRAYPMGHSVCIEEITAISDWLQVCLR